MKIINWKAIKESKTYMIATFIIGFFAIVGAVQFIAALFNFIF